MGEDPGLSLTQYYTATTLDGFIADENHSLDWLFTRNQDRAGPLNYAEFFASVGRSRWARRRTSGSSITSAGTRTPTAAVRFGVATTARIITGAALIIVAVLAGFATGDLVMFQQMGFGVAAALLLDATIIRSVILSSTMRLLGRWNWYLPAGSAGYPDSTLKGRSTPAERLNSRLETARRFAPLRDWVRQDLE